MLCILLRRLEMEVNDTGSLTHSSHQWPHPHSHVNNKVDKACFLFHSVGEQLNEA